MSVALNKQIVAIHKNDPQWIIALWLAIHGGDPAPEFIPNARVEDIAASAIKSLSAYLPAARQKAIAAAMR